MPEAGRTAAAEPAPQASEDRAEQPLASLLLVDDSLADVEITQFRLVEGPKLRCNFMVAQSGEEALAMLRYMAQAGRKIDLLLLDINMPEMNGFELLEKIRGDAVLKQISVVICTGSTYDKDQQRARKLGASGISPSRLTLTS